MYLYSYPKSSILLSCCNLSLTLHRRSLQQCSRPGQVFPLYRHRRHTPWCWHKIRRKCSHYGMRLHPNSTDHLWCGCLQLLFLRSLIRRVSEARYRSLHHQRTANHQFYSHIRSSDKGRGICPDRNRRWWRNPRRRRRKPRRRKRQRTSRWRRSSWF